MESLYDVADEMEIAPVEEVPRCPQCSLPMGGGAVVCIGCGYDSRSGKRLSTEAAQKPKAGLFRGKKKVEDRMAADGSFLLGLLISGICALVASVVWIGVAWLTDREIGWIAILIGAAAGVGMQAGHRGYSTIGGYGAAAMTLVAILAAKFAVLLIVLMPKLDHLNPNWSLADLNFSVLGFYFFHPISCIIMLIGMGFAFKTANGSSK